MGYYTSFSGAFTFSRPLTFLEIPTVPEADAFGLVTKVEPRETPEGRLEVITATAIEAKDLDEVKAYDAVDQMESMLKALPEDVEITGEIRGEGEEAGDVRRYVVTDGRKVKEMRPRLVWEDGYEEAGRA